MTKTEGAGVQGSERVPRRLGGAPLGGELARWINAHHGSAFRLGARYLHGEQGAYALAEGEGKASRRFVLKWQAGTALPPEITAAVALTERLRAVGYPAPRYRLVDVATALGVVYTVQEALPGTPLGGRLDDAVLDQLLALNARQRGPAAVLAPAWPRHLATLSLHGGAGFCLLEPMRTHSAATADLLATVQHTAAHAEEPAPAGDVVHFDFQGSNILVQGDRVSGVVDWESARIGDCAFDLATLFFCADGWEVPVAAGVAARLWQALQVHTTPGLRRLYLAHMLHRQVDWALRFLGPALIERNLRRAEQVLRLLAAEEQTA